MKKLLTGAVVLGLAAASQAVLIDDFNDTDVSEYTATVILDANGGAGNTFAVQSPSGTMEVNTSVYDGIEQMAIVRSGLSLAVGEEVQVDLTHSGASQDIGLYVGGTTPVAGTRQDYVAVYARGDGALYSRGFDGTSEYGLDGAGVQPYTQLFIARTAANTYETGYYNGATRNVISTRTPGTANDGTVVGFYTDVRGAGTLGNLDNLQVIPEPATIGLIGIFGAGLFASRRMFKR